MGIKIDNTKISKKPWSDVDKTDLGKKLVEAKATAAIKEAYLYSPDLTKRSSFKFAHHELEGDTLIINSNGVHSAAQRFVSTGSTASDIPKKAAAKHLLRHYNAMKEDPPESLTSLGKSLTVQELEIYTETLRERYKAIEKYGHLEHKKELPSLKEQIEEYEDILIEMQMDNIVPDPGDDDDKEVDNENDPGTSADLSTESESIPGGHSSIEEAGLPSKGQAEPEGYIHPVNEEEIIDEETGNTGEGKQTDWEDPNEDEDEDAEIEADQEASMEKPKKPKKSLMKLAKKKGLTSPDGDGLIRPKFLFSISFDESKQEHENVQTKAARPKTPQDYHPNEEEMAKINSLSNVDLAPLDLYSFNLKSADLVIDRGYEQFTPKALKQMATMSVDKPMLIDHQWSTKNVVGKIYDASVKNKALMQKVYMLNIPENQGLIKNILAGIFNKVSVGFAMNPMEYMCNSCGKSMYSDSCPHRPGIADEKGAVSSASINGVRDYYEVSLVAVPMQPAAGIRRDELPFGDLSNGMTNDKSMTVNDFRTKTLAWGSLGKDGEALILNENHIVDKIDNEKSITLGESIVSEDKKENLKDVKAEEQETKAVVADATPDAEAAKKQEGHPESEVEMDDEDDKKSKALVKSLEKTVKRLEKTCRRLQKAVKKSATALTAISKSQEDQSALITKAMNISTEDLERALMAKAVEEAENRPIQKTGFLGDIVTAVDKSRQ